MQPDLLQQLRDLHSPAPPAWWPPAPGWWVIAGLTIVAVGLIVRAGWRAWVRRRPIRRARELHANLAQRRRAGAIDDHAYVNGCNELLKRLLIHGLGVEAARPVSAEPWLALLDTALGEPAFSRGAGRALGVARFTPAPAPDTQALEDLMERFLRRISPRITERLR